MNFIEAMRQVREGNIIKSLNSNTSYSLDANKKLCRKGEAFGHHIVVNDLFEEWEVEKTKYDFAQALELMSKGKVLSKVGSGRTYTMVCGELSYWDIDNWETYGITKDILSSKWELVSE